jgi:hypothetical protein
MWFLVLAGIAIGGWALSRASSTQGKWTPVDARSLPPGSRVRLAIVVSTQDEDAALVQAFMADEHGGYISSLHAWHPGEAGPTDWPPASVDVAQTLRFEFTVNNGEPLSPKSPTFAWVWRAS